MLARALRLWRTVRWLKPVQVLARLWHILHTPSVSEKALPQRADFTERGVPSEWVLPARRKPSMLGPVEFQFLNETNTLEVCGWDEPSVAKLWRYNLHYFDDLNAHESAARKEWHQALVGRWITENPPFEGSGWEPYPTSLRIVNWIKWALSGHADLSSEFERSLALQARWLRKRLEHHLLGNHLFVNAKALIFAGVWFGDSPEGREWFRVGERILEKQIPEQFLKDGGQFERSPMYHALGLEDLLDLLNVCRAFSRCEFVRNSRVLSEAALRPRISRALNFLEHVSFADGRLAHFNDSAAGVSPDNAELMRYSGELGVAGSAEQPGLAARKVRSALESGYVRISDEQFEAIVDVAPIGPDYLPGHAHADTLSFESYFRGLPLIVNSGTSEYGLGEERLRQRGTAAHSTVCVDGQNSSEVWSGFRVARRARPIGLDVRESADEVVVACGHDGYCRLSGSPVHKRRWRLSSAGLEVEDRIDGNFDKAVAHFHLHPDVKVSQQTARVFQLQCGDECLEMRVHTGCAELLDSSYHPEFGLVQRSQQIAVQLEGNHSRVQFVPT